jgi:hypothetical protein
LARALHHQTRNPAIRGRDPSRPSPAVEEIAELSREVNPGILMPNHDRLLRPLLAADQPPAPPPLRKALRTIDTHIAERIENARLLLKAA